VKNRFQSLPFKCNLQRYIEVEGALVGLTLFTTLFGSQNTVQFADSQYVPCNQSDTRQPVWFHGHQSDTRQPVWFHVTDLTPGSQYGSM
jgi:hypothetical protein